MKHLNPKNFPVLPLSPYLPLLPGEEPQLLSEVQELLCLRTSVRGKSFLGGIPQDRLMLLAVGV